MSIKITRYWYTPQEKMPREKEHLLLNIGSCDEESYYYQSGYYENKKWYKSNNYGISEILGDEYIAGWCYTRD